MQRHHENVLCAYIKPEQAMAFRSCQVSQWNNNPVNARWMSGETQHVIALMGRRVIAPLDGSSCDWQVQHINRWKSQLAVSLNKKATWKVVNMKRLQTLWQFLSMSSAVSVVSVMRNIENRNGKIWKLYWVPKLTIQFFADFHKNRPDKISYTSIIHSLVSCQY